MITSKKQNYQAYNFPFSKDAIWGARNFRDVLAENEGKAATSNNNKVKANSSNR